MKSRIALIAGVALFSAASVVVGGSIQPAHDVQDRVIVRGAVIRLGSPPTIIDDDRHASVGVSSVGLYRDCDLLIVTDVGGTVDRIVAAIADEDETLSRMGIRAGVRGGTHSTRVMLYSRKGHHICADASRFDGTLANVWVQLTYLAD